MGWKESVLAFLAGLGAILKVTARAVDEYMRKKRVKEQTEANESIINDASGDLMREYNQGNKASDDNKPDLDKD